MSENVRISCDLKEARGERHKGKTERADGNCKCDEETRNVSAEAKKGIFRNFCLVHNIDSAYSVLL